MKEYINPIIKVEVFSTTNFITTSSGVEPGTEGFVNGIASLENKTQVNLAEARKVIKFVF